LGPLSSSGGIPRDAAGFFLLDTVCPIKATIGILERGCGGRAELSGYLIAPHFRISEMDEKFAVVAKFLQPASNIRSLIRNACG
jgi:hypothetical protein